MCANYIERKKLKDDWKSSLDYLMKQKRMKELLACLNLNHYKFQVLTKEYRKQAIDLLSYSFSYLGGTDYGIIFKTSFNDNLSYYEMIVDHVLNTGLSMIAIDKNNQIAMVILSYDIVDEPIMNKSLISESKSRIFELDNELEKLIVNKFKASCNNSYRNYMFGGWMCIRPDLIGKNSNLVTILMSIPHSIINYLGYKCVIGNVNSRSIKFFRGKDDTKILNELDYAHYTFADNTSMDYYYKLSNNENIKHFKQLLKIYLVELNFDIWREKKLSIVDTVIYEVYHKFQTRIKAIPKL